MKADIVSIPSSNPHKIIIPTNIKPHPNKYEETVAQILAQRFQSDVIFIARSTNHTPDLQIVKTQQYWEIKNIRGNSKNTIEDNIRKATKRGKVIDFCTPSR